MRRGAHQSAPVIAVAAAMDRLTAGCGDADSTDGSESAGGAPVPPSAISTPRSRRWCGSRRPSWGPDDWLDRILAAQRADGGWGERVSTWHTTLLAVWTVLAETEADREVDMVGGAA